MKHALVSFALFCALQITLSAQAMKVFVEDKLTFTANVKVSQQGGLTTKTIEYFDMNSQLAAIEKTTYNSGTLEIAESSVENYYTGAFESMKRESDGSYTAFFREKKGGKEQKDRFKEEHQVVNLPVLEEYIQRKKTLLLKEETVEVGLISPSRMKSATMELELTSSEQYKGKKTSVIRMRPGSWIVRQFVKDIFFWMPEKIDGSPLRYKGRLTPTDPNGKLLYGECVYN